MITECNAFDYEFSPVTFGKRFGTKVYGFEMEAKAFEATFYVFGNNRKEYINRLFADFDYDVQNEKIGTLECNGYSIPAFSLAASGGSNNSSDLLWDTFKRKFYCPYPFWSKQTAFLVFNQPEEVVGDTDIKDYVPGSEGGTADYDYDYQTKIGSGSTFVNTDINGSDFKLIINGYAQNPSIRINGLPIDLNLTLQQNEHLTIDSREKTVVLTHSNGVKENCFGYRDVSVDIFKKIASGTVFVTWGNFSWTLTLYDERTAPLWN